MNMLLIIIFSLPIIYFIYNVLLYLKTKVPIIITPKEYYKELFNNLKITENMNIYELGCGKGDFLFAAEQFNPKKSIGFELSLFHAFYGKIKAKIIKSKINILYQDFFKANISDADMIYLFLVQPIIIKAWKKIKNETKKGTVVATLSDTIPNESYFKKIPTRPNNPNTSYYYLYIV